MKRVDCPLCRCSQLVAAVVHGKCVCRYCRKWFELPKPKPKTKLVVGRPKTRLGGETPQYARASAIIVDRKKR